MIELKLNKLVVSFPDLPLRPQLSIDFQRTLRIPDDGKNYPLPPGFGSFPLRHIDDFGARLPENWLKRGGVLLPMWPSEAMWLNFRGEYIFDRVSAYPFAIKVAAGKINAVTGEGWQQGLDRNPQNYLVAPKQPWLDGYCVEKGVIRQFVAMPLGEGYSPEEQLTGQAEFGGLQLEIFPMKADVFERRCPIVKRARAAATLGCVPASAMAGLCEDKAMGLAPGGRMRQEIFEDPYSIHDWDLEHGSRCFVHLINCDAWQPLTGETPPGQPLSAAEYARHGYPWFDYYDSKADAVRGSKILASLKSVSEKAAEKGATPPVDNASLRVNNIINLRAGLARQQVRESDF